MLQLEILILELLSEDRLSTSSVTHSEVSSLGHEAWDDSVELGTLEMEWLSTLSYSLLSSAESLEVLNGLWDGVSKESEDDSSASLTIDFDVEVDLLSDGVDGVS